MDRESPRRRKLSRCACYHWIVTRQTADGSSETVIHPEAAHHAALLALHQALMERRRKPK